MTETRSALYPTERGAPARPAPAAWFSTLRTVLERTATDGGPGTAARLPGDGDAAAAEAGPPAPPDASGAAPANGSPDLADRLARLAPEAADVPPELLREVLERNAANIAGLVRAFQLPDDALLTALGRGWLPDGRGVDPVVRDAQPAVPELSGIVASGCVTVSRDGLSTTLIAAMSVTEPVGPVKLTSPYWAQNGMHDVWLCTVALYPDEMGLSCALLERILPQAGVVSAHLTPSRPPAPGPADGGGPRSLTVAISQVATDRDTDVVLGRLEGWRSAVEQLGDGRVTIAWERA